MIAALAYLTLRSTWNRLRRQAAQLRKPRYVLALFAGAAYLWLVFDGGRYGPDTAPVRPETVELLGALLLAGMVVWSWAFGGERRALAFTPAEVTFLFPAPLTRRALIHHKLIRSQLAILISTAIWTLVLARGAGELSPPLRALALWVAFSTLQLHRIGASLVRASLGAYGRHGARQVAVSLVVLAAVALALVASAASSLPALQAAWQVDPETFLAAMGAALREPIPHGLLAPFRLLLAPLGAATPDAWLAALPGPLLLLAAHYVWVLRSDVAFEEAAAEQALDRVRRIDAGETPRRTPASRRLPRWLWLRPTGRPAIAIVWKNVVAVYRTSSARITALIIGGAMVVSAASIIGAGSSLTQIAGTLSAIWAVLFLIVGPQWVRNDLRSDLPKLDLLRSYPLSGAAIVLAEASASALLVTMVQWGLLSVAFVSQLGSAGSELPPGARWLAPGAALVLLPCINLIGLLLLNGAALLFPGWVRTGVERPGGVEALGQSMLAIVGYLLALGVALAAPAAMAAGVLALPWSSNPLPAAIAAAAVAVGAMLLEAVLLVRRLGGVLERTEPADVQA